MFALAWLTALASAHAALADSARRVALVVGNSKYVFVPRLANPANDARLIARTLQHLGFTLVGGRAQLNLDKTHFDQLAQQFGREAQGADVALFYYAGHGLQIDGENYLVPVGANPRTKADIFFQMLDTNVMLQEMEGSGARLKLMILDACRNNPFAGRGFRALGGGLAQMEAPEGTMISFATQPGKEAFDGRNGHSPFSAALAQVIRQPGLSIFNTFNRVGLIVSHETHGQQRPWLASSPIKGDFYFAGPPVDPLAQQAARYAAAAKVDTPEALNSFLSLYKSGYYADLARAERDKILSRARAKAAVAERDKAEAEAQARAAALAQARRDAAAAKLAQQAAEKTAQEAAARGAAQAQAAKEAIDKARRELAAAKAAQAAAEKAAQAANARRDAEVKAANEAIAKAQKEAAAKAAKLAAAKAAQERQASEHKVASLTPPGQSPVAGVTPALNTTDIVQLLKVHLRAAGCNPGDVNGEWDEGARRALTDFNKHAGTHLDVGAPKLATLETLQGVHGRVCPLVCGRGTRQEGDHCVAITCKAGYALDAKGDCKRLATRPSGTAHKPSKRTRRSSSHRHHLSEAEHARLRTQCRSNGLGACRTLCKAGYQRACHKLQRISGFGRRLRWEQNQGRAGPD